LECKYCVGWHSAASRHHGAEADKVQLVGSYEEHRDSFSEMQLAVFDYASKVAREAYKVTDEEFENLKRWYSDAELVELTETACHMASLSKLFTALNVEIW
jgi:alkylhydroperoxidase family enzyme